MNINIKLSLIGLGLVILSGVLVNVFPPIAPFIFIFTFIGVFLTVGIYSEGLFIDYITFENDNYICSIKKKSYYHCFPIDLLLSFFNMNVKFPYKADYYKFITPTLDIDNINLNDYKINKKDYKLLLESQEEQYLNKNTPPELVDYICSPKEVKLNLTKAGYIICLVMVILSLSGLTVPSDWALVLFHEVVFVSLTLMFYKKYKKAKFKTMIYNNYFNGTDNDQ